MHGLDFNYWEEYLSKTQEEYEGGIQCCTWLGTRFIKKKKKKEYEYFSSENLLLDLPF